MFRWYIGDKLWEQSAIFVDYRLHYFCTVLYVFLECIKKVVRAVVNENIRDYKDPVGSRVSLCYLDAFIAHDQSLYFIFHQSLHLVVLSRGEIYYFYWDVRLLHLSILSRRGGGRGIGRDFDIFPKIAVKFPTAGQKCEVNILKFPTPGNDMWSRAWTKIQMSLLPAQQDNSNALPPGQSDWSNPPPAWHW